MGYFTLVMKKQLIQDFNPECTTDQFLTKVNFALGTKKVILTW